MATFLSRFAALAAWVSLGGCSFLPLGGGGGGGGSFTPSECTNTQFTGDLGQAKEGQWVTYAMEAGGSKSTNTVRIVGQESGQYWVEHWMDMGQMAYGYLYLIGGDKKITKAWVTPKEGKEWKEIAVKEPPKVQPQEGPKPTIKESDEKKDVKAGSYQCHRLEVTVNVQGKDCVSQSWYSKDASKIYAGGEHGGLIAMEASGSKTALEAKGEDAKPTIALPKK